MSAADVRHPVFARCYERLSRVFEKDLAEHREELLAGIAGRVVEVGAGNGMNFRHYPASVDEVVALEPEHYLRERAEEAAVGAAVAVSVRSGRRRKARSQELLDRSGSGRGLRAAVTARATPSQRPRRPAFGSSGCEGSTSARRGS